MIFWRVTPSLEYYYLGLKHENDAKLLNFAGKSLIYSWYPLQVEVIKNEGKIMSDFPAMTGGTLVCSDKALTVIKSLIGQSVEFLPLQCAENDFFIINVIDIVNCLDKPLSDIEYFKSGNIKSITRYIFKPNCLEDKPIFKIPERMGGPIFVSNAFKELVETNKLQGLDFKQVWEE